MTTIIERARRVARECFVAFFVAVRIATVAALIATPTLLSACAGQQVPSAQVEQAINDVQTLAAGLQGALPELGQVKGIPASVVAQVGDAVAKMQTIAAQMKSATTASEAQPFVQQLEALVNAAVTAVTPFVAATPVGPIFAAAAVLLPIIEAAVGLLIPATTARAMAATMSPDQARLILEAAEQR